MGDSLFNDGCGGMNEETDFVWTHEHDGQQGYTSQQNRVDVDGIRGSWYSEVDGECPLYPQTRLKLNFKSMFEGSKKFHSVFKDRTASK